MVVFTRFYFLGKPLILCATTGFFWSKLNDDRDIPKQQLNSTAELICQAFKEKQGIPGI
jgi:hypothetical protein